MAQAVDIANRPNMREFMDATGVDSKTASEIIYGTIGANTDQRDWAAIMASQDPVQASIDANFAQYSSGAATSGLDKTAYPTNFGNPDGTKAGIVKTGTGFALVSSDGVPLRAGFRSLEQAQEQGKYFGISEFLGDSNEITSSFKEPVPTPATPAQTQPTPSSTPVQDQMNMQVNPVPETVNLQVTPPTYSGGITAVTEGDERAGTFSKPLQTAGLSAVPQNVQVKTHYAGTPGLVDPNLLLPTGSSGSGLVDPTLTLGGPTTQGNVGFANGGLMSSTVPRETNVARNTYSTPLQNYNTFTQPTPYNQYTVANTPQCYTPPNYTPPLVNTPPSYTPPVVNTPPSYTPPVANQFTQATMDPIVDDLSDFLGDTDPTMDPIVDEMPTLTKREERDARFEERDALRDTAKSAEREERKQRKASEKQLREIENQQRDMFRASKRDARQPSIDANQEFRKKLNTERKMRQFNNKITAGKWMLSNFPTAEAAASAYIAKNPRAAEHRAQLESGYNDTKKFMETAEDRYVSMFGTPYLPYLRSGYGVGAGQKIGDASLGAFPTPLADQLKANPPKGNPFGKPSNMATGGDVRGYASGGLMSSTVPRETTLAGQPHRLAYVNPQEEEMMKKMGGSGIPGPGGVPSYISWSDVKDFFSGSSTPEPASGSSTFSSDKNEVNETTAAANESSNKNYITATTYSNGEWGYSTIEKPNIDDDNDSGTSNAVVVNEEVVPPPPPVITEPEPPVVNSPVVSNPVVSNPVTYSPPPPAPTPVSSDGVTSVPQTVTQKVTAPSYGGDSTTSFKALASDDERSGTFSKPLQTAGLSAVPEQVTYKTHYAGTPNLVDPTLLTSTGSSTGGTQQIIYENKQTGQEIIVTVLGGSPVTYVPPGFTPKGVIKPSEGSENMAEGGYMRGYTEGGSVDKMLESKFIIAKRYGYSGPKTNESLNAYAKSSPLISGKFRQIGVMMNQGGLAMAQGGTVPNQATIGGQPHRLAYVNPQEEALMKASGGAGVPSYGGIPAYFTLGKGTTVGETATDPTAGTVYTWNGTSWDMSQSAPLTYGGMSSVAGQVGETNTDNQVQSWTGTTPEQFKKMQQNLVAQTMQPTQANVQYIQPTANQFMPVDAGQATPIAPYAEAATVGTVQQAELPTNTAASTFDSFNVFPNVSAETSAMQPVQGAVSDQAQVSAAQQQGSSVSGMAAATGQSVDVTGAPTRTQQAGEMIDGSAVDQAQVGAAFGTGEVQAASVQGELANLMQQFEGGETPAWAAGSMRAASQMLAARGLGASSLAGQAVIQAAMEAALPIAQIDAGNKQQMALFKAEQRAKFLQIDFDQAFQAKVMNAAKVSEIANMNFTAEQNIALENSRAANTMNLNNLSNSQAMVMAEAAALSNLDMANLNNRQQAAVQNAQNFMQMDMANLSNEQQTAMFKTQQNVQALFTDQAAENAARQFNSASENQTSQFFSNLANQTAQFNASQQNAMDQFNVNSVNALREFNSNIQQQRDMFNAQNGLVIAQSNAQWRQNLDTINTAALNDSNREFAATMNGLTAGNLEQIWQRERDIMSFAFSSSESARDRGLSILMAEMEVSALDKKLEAAESSGKTKFLLDVFEDPLKNLASDLVSGFI